MRQQRAARALVWLTLARGLLALALGLAILFWPHQAGPMLGNFIGMYMLVTGAMTLRWWLAYDRHTTLPGLAGGLGILTGLVIVGRLLLERWLPAVTIGQVLGILALLSGWTHVVGGFDVPATAHRFRAVESFLLGGFEVLLGILLIFYPLVLDSTEPRPGLTSLLVGWALVGGVTLLADAARRGAALRAAEQTGDRTLSV